MLLDYVRVYAPSGSTLLAVEGADQYEVSGQENGKSVFAAYFVLAPGENRQITFRYILPSTILSKKISPDIHYTLQIQKQPGTLAIPLQVHIELPPGTKAFSAHPEPELLNSEAVEFASKLQIDRRFEVLLQSDD